HKCTDDRAPNLLGYSVPHSLRHRILGGGLYSWPLRLSLSILLAHSQKKPPRRGPTVPRGLSLAGQTTTAQSEHCWMKVVSRKQPLRGGITLDLGAESVRACRPPYRVKEVSRLTAWSDTYPSDTKRRILLMVPRALTVLPPSPSASTGA